VYQLFFKKIEYRAREHENTFEVKSLKSSRYNFGDFNARTRGDFNDHTSVGETLLYDVFSTR